MPNYNTFSAATIKAKEEYWHPLRERLRTYLKRAGAGAAIALAKALGTHSSQVHRWTCPKCEHDAEPSFSRGMQIHVFLSNWEANPTTYKKQCKGNTHKTSRNRKGRPKQQRRRIVIKAVFATLEPQQLVHVDRFRPGNN